MKEQILKIIHNCTTAELFKLAEQQKNDVLISKLIDEELKERGDY